MFCRRNYQTVFKFLFLVTRVQWSKDEEQELREYLSDYIGKKCPGMKACKYAIEQSKKKWRKNSVQKVGHN